MKITGIAIVTENIICNSIANCTQVIRSDWKITAIVNKTKTQKPQLKL